MVSVQPPIHLTNTSIQHITVTGTMSQPLTASTPAAHRMMPKKLMKAAMKAATLKTTALKTTAATKVLMILNN